MKIVKAEKEKHRTVTLRIPKAVMEKVDKVAEKNTVSRQLLITAILKQVLEDKKFVLKITEN
jgi:metal-responsive CopG/Arc/MetJ family transcriptional regulator